MKYIINLNYTANFDPLYVQGGECISWLIFRFYGVTVAGGSDGPISYDASPFLTIYGALTRQTAAGTLGPQEAISREEALRMVTINVVRLMFREKQTGSIEVGKYADLVVLSDDVLRVPAEEIPRLKVLATILGGEVVYERQGHEIPG